MAKILITGTGGFIFSNVVLYLMQHTKHTVVGIDKLTYAGSLLNCPEMGKRYRLRIGDVCDYDFVAKVFEIEKPDIVIHGAAESHVDNSIKGSHEFIKTNVLGTHSMLEAALKVHTPEKFINISTDEVYGSVVEGRSLETDAFDPRSPYSSSKASADLLGQSYFTTYGLPVIITRCCNNFGGRQHTEKLIPKTIFNIMNAKPIPVYGDGKQVREWIFVKDNYRALMKIIENGVPGQAYNISTDEGLTNLEVLDTIFEIMGGGEDLVEFVEDRPGHDLRYAVSSEKIRALGWSPMYEFKPALAHTIAWYKKNQSWFGK